MTVVEPWTPVAVLVAVTESGKLPLGVPCVTAVLLHPANVSTASRPPQSSPNRSPRSFLFRLLPLPVRIPTNPSNGRGSTRAAYNGAARTPSAGSNAVTALFPVVFTVMVTVAVVILSDAGLNAQVTPNGAPGQPKVIVPRGGLVEAVTVNVNDAEPPCGTMALPLMGVIFSGDAEVVVSLAVSLAVLSSPPPETVAV